MIESFVDNSRGRKEKRKICQEYNENVFFLPLKKPKMAPQILSIQNWIGILSSQMEPKKNYGHNIHII